MTADWLSIAEKLLPYALGSGGVMAWLTEKKNRRQELGNMQTELTIKVRELEDAKSAKNEELLRGRDQQMYEELRQYCGKLESRIDKLETQQETWRVAAEAAQQAAHAKDLELQAARTRLEMINSRCNNACGMAGLILPAIAVPT